MQRVWTLGVLAALCAAVPAAFAQNGPPTRVGRLSYIGGSVSFEPAGTRQWAAAELNRPVTIGDRIWTDWDSRAEIEIGDAVIRLGSRTGFSFLNLNADTAQMQLTAGTLIVHVRTLAAPERDEVDTPNLALILERPGTYRLHVNSAGDKTVVQVIDGQALASGGGQTYPIAAQQRATFSGTNTLNVAYTTLGSPDALEQWSLARDRQEARAANEVTRYVSPEMVGIYDLDTYGSWQDTPQWGYAWFPNVVAGWAPYRFGHWVWVFPWGWTWLDDEPWGFAPFHYGRWAFWHHAWCWVPGPRHVRPVYAPALVAWTHGRHRGGRSVGRHVGWLPLGPHDVYLPGYAASRSYIRDVNLTNDRALTARFVTDADRRRGRGIRYANRHISGAITAVPRAAFSASKPADAHRIVLTRRGLLKVRFGAQAPPVIPSRASVFGAHLHTLNVPPRQLTHRSVVARRPPARAPVTFAQQQAAIRANGGRALTTHQWARLRPTQPDSTVRLAPEVHRARAHHPAVRSGRSGGPERSRTPAREFRPARRRPRVFRTRPRHHLKRPNEAQSRTIRSGAQLRSPSRRRPPQRAVPHRSMPRPQRHVPRPRKRTGRPQHAQHPPMFSVTLPRRRRSPVAFGAVSHADRAVYRAQHFRAVPRMNPSMSVHRHFSPSRVQPPTFRPMQIRRTAPPHPSARAAEGVGTPVRRAWTVHRP